VPPTDYDAPYSAMPITVTLKKVKQKVKNSYIKMAKEKAKEMCEKPKYKPGIKKAGLTTMKGATGSAAEKKDFKLPSINPINEKRLATKVVSDEPRDKKEHWLNLLDLEHADALISDAYWYIICKVCNPQPEFE